MRLVILLLLLTCCRNSPKSLSYEKTQLETFYSNISVDRKFEKLNSQPPSNSSDSICILVLKNLLELSQKRTFYKDGLSKEERNRLFVQAQADSSSVFNFIFIEFYNGNNSNMDRLTKFADDVCSSSSFFEIKNPYSPVEPIVLDKGEK